MSRFVNLGPGLLPGGYFSQQDSTGGEKGSMLAKTGRKGRSMEKRTTMVKDLTEGPAAKSFLLR